MLPAAEEIEWTSDRAAASECWRGARVPRYRNAGAELSQPSRRAAYLTARPLPASSGWSPSDRPNGHDPIGRLGARRPVARSPAGRPSISAPPSRRAPPGGAAARCSRSALSRLRRAFGDEAPTQAVTIFALSDHNKGEATWCRAELGPISISDSGPRTANGADPGKIRGPEVLPSLIRVVPCSSSRPIGCRRRAVEPARRARFDPNALDLLAEELLSRPRGLLLRRSAALVSREKIRGRAPARRLLAKPKTRRDGEADISGDRAYLQPVCARDRPDSRCPLGGGRQPSARARLIRESGRSRFGA